MKKHLQFKLPSNQIIDYYLEEKNIKNCWMKIDKNNLIVVSVPFNFPKEIVELFIKNNIEKFAKITLERQAKSIINFKEKFFYLFGQAIDFTIDAENKTICFLDKNKNFKNKKPEEIITKYQKNTLKKYIVSRQRELETIMNIKPHQIYIRNKTRAWGTNHITNTRIFYSLNLVPFSYEIIDYVIIHELAHSKFPNHSKDFWKLVEKYDPDYKTKKMKLKKYIYS